MVSTDKVAVLGAGSMGCSVAQHLSGIVPKVTLWSPDKTEIEMLSEEREHLSRLPGIKLNENISYTTSLEEAVEGVDIVILAIPSQTTRQNTRALNKLVPEKIIVTCSKGIETGTGKLLTEIMSEEMPNAKIVVLSGPSHAEEIARDIPTTLTATSNDIKYAEIIQDLFMNESLRVYTNEDVIGVELGGALKNVIALSAGISDGLGFGDNTKAAIMTRGIAEISRLGVAMGANLQTFYGLTGVGDLIVTCTSKHSRNRRAGVLIGGGMEASKAIEEVRMVVEGYATALPAYELSIKYGVEMPIVTEVYRILYEGKDPRKAVTELMLRDKKHENDGENAR